MCTIKIYRFIISALGSAYINDYEKYTKETFYLLICLSEINFDYRRIVFFYTLLNNKNTPFIVNKQYCTKKNTSCWEKFNNNATGEKHKQNG
jgi:hypothetical protein